MLVFFIFRARRQRRSLASRLSANNSLPLSRRDLAQVSEEEREPLDRPWSPARAGEGGYTPTRATGSPRTSKGKGRSLGGKATVLDESEGEAEEALFDVGDDADDDSWDRNARR